MASGIERPVFNLNSYSNGGTANIQHTVAADGG
jgi:hypothetical protein